MMLAPARVQDACARVNYGSLTMSFHRVSEPIAGGLPCYVISAAGRTATHINDAGHGSPWSAALETAAVRLASQGVSHRQIAQAIGRTEDAVERRLRLIRGRRV